MQTSTGFSFRPAPSTSSVGLSTSKNSRTPFISTHMELSLASVVVEPLRQRTGPAQRLARNRYLPLDARMTDTATRRAALEAAEARGHAMLDAIETGGLIRPGRSET